MHTFPLKPPALTAVDPLHALSRNLTVSWLLGEGAGNLAHGSALTNYHRLSLNSVPASNPWIAGSRGGLALRFDGSATYGLSQRSVAVGSRFSVTAWCRAAASPTAAFARIAETAYNAGFFLGAGSDGGSYATFINGTIGGGGAGLIVANRWDFVCLTYDGTNGRLYQNAVLVDTTPATAPSTTLPIYVGRNFEASDSFWEGSIENVRYYPGRTLSDDDVKWLYREPYAGFGVEEMMMSEAAFVLPYTPHRQSGPMFAWQEDYPE